MIPILVVVPGLALAGLAPSMQAVQGPARGCATVAVYLYAKLMGAPVDYGRCAERFPSTAVGASLREMEDVSAEFGVPLEARAVSWADLRGWEGPLIFLAAPRYAARLPDGSAAQVGHYLAARPLAGGCWQVYDFPAERPAVLSAGHLSDYLGIPAGEEVIVLAGFPPADRAGGSAPATYRPAARVGADRGDRTPIELGPVDAPGAGQVLAVNADISGRGVGEAVEVRIDLWNPGPGPIDLAPGHASCGCAALTLGSRHLEPAGVATLRGRILVSASMRTSPEFSEITVARPDAAPATLRLVVSGSPVVRAIVEPPVVAFGPTPSPGPPLHARVRITAPDPARYEPAAGPGPRGGFSARVLSHPDPGVTIVEVTLDPSVPGLGRVRGSLRLADATGSSPDLDIPVEATLRPSLRADPPALVLTGAAARLRVTDDTGAPAVPVAVDGLAGVSVTIDARGTCTLTAAGSPAARVQEATVRVTDGRTLTVPVLLRP